ncbi:SitI3 family protein [Pseudoduganella albidiflava]|uniref:Uncharacterized protein n=1 Tax=Pseudoduganella albidiflava TaxID=321983 RepID=A0A411WUJ5_9BURK|nr:SitI3 family protein [Pseudoduganella albidiflava]QBI00443.1 hypothetical protein EYF70_05935 [Pseudoduganella albidiflava]GGY33286.1 hypothetical protein GCM10007387_14460 [Pseudoduganella albidiflava]
MSLHYTLSIAAPGLFDTLAKRLQELPGYRPAAGGIAAPDLQIDMSPPDEVEAGIIEEAFGFTPTASISFWVDKEAERVAMRTALLRGCMALLEITAGDAVLLFNGETVILLRRQDALLLNPLEKFWTDEVLAVLPADYRFKAMPVI